MTNLKKVQTSITVGNSDDMILPILGDIPFVARDKYGQAYNKATLVQMLVHPKLPYNLFSITKVHYT